MEQDYDVQHNDGLQGAKSNSYVQNHDDGLTNVQNVRFNLKQEFDERDFTNFHDVDVLDTAVE